jgi:NADPH2:quinone reductase
MTQYGAWVAENPNKNPDDFKNLRCEWRQRPVPQLGENEVQVRVQWSSINFKDALALTGTGKILRALPLTPGIDASGLVMASRSPLYKEGDEVLVTGSGLGENRDGGFGEVITVPESWVLARPRNLSLKDCMVLGTAGFTAGLALHQLEKNDLTPQKGSVLVTGASGGVGSLSLILLRQKKYSTVAWSRKKEQFSWLKKIGAETVENVKDKDWNTRPLESSLWAAAIDNVGSDILSYVIPRIAPHGNVASIGLAKSAELKTTVFPFILRGVNILGISSATCPRPLREKIWRSLDDTRAPWSDALTATLNPQDLPAYAQDMVSGKTFGRAIVKMA